MESNQVMRASQKDQLLELALQLHRQQQVVAQISGAAEYEDRGLDVLKRLLEAAESCCTKLGNPVQINESLSTLPKAA